MIKSNFLVATFCLLLVVIAATLLFASENVEAARNSNYFRKKNNQKQQRRSSSEQQGRRSSDYFKLLNATKPFWQLNSTRMLFNSQSPLANWQKIPIQKRVDILLFDESSRRYVAVADGFTSLWSASEEELLGNSPGKAFKKHSAQWLSISSHWLGQTLAPSQCLEPSLTPAACSSAPGSGVAASSSLLFVSPMSSVHCKFAPAAQLTCVSGNVTGVLGSLNAKSLNAIAVSASPIKGDNKTQSAVLIATEHGLVSLLAITHMSFHSVLIPMKNTTGSVVQNGNFTWVQCLPPSHYESLHHSQDSSSSSSSSSSFLQSLHRHQSSHQAEEKLNIGGEQVFFDADCFGATSEKYCSSNICPADLFHNIRARSAQDLGRVQPHSFERIPGIIDARPTAAVYTPSSSDLFLGNQVCVNTMHHTGSLRRYSGFNGGLPLNQIQSGAWLNLSHAHNQMRALALDAAALDEVEQQAEKEADGLVFFGTPRGAIAKLPDDSEREEEGKWKMLLGGRWLPGNLNSGQNVTSMASGSRSVLAATDSGFALFFPAVWRPVDKARHFQETVAPRHQRSDGIFTDNHLAKWGDASTSMTYGTANDGLWTGMRLCQEAMRWIASGKTDQTARANAWKAFNGLETLVNVTGIPGLMGRSAWHCPKNASANGCTNGKPNGNQWRQSPSMNDYFWWPTASSDEVDGHFAGRTCLYELVAETPAEKARVGASYMEIISYIVDNNLQLIDWNGKPTHWGRWNNAQLRDFPGWYDNQGNCGQILGWLSGAWKISKNQTFANVFEELRDKHGYASAMLNMKITQPDDFNYSDDELQMVALLQLALTSMMSDGTPNKLFVSIAQVAEESMYRLWKVIRGGRFAESLWGALFVGLDPLFSAVKYPNQLRHWRDRDQAREDMWDFIVNFPMDFVEWPVDNSQRLGLIWAPHNSRSGHSHTVLENLFPQDELHNFRWNGNPFDVSGGSGMGESSPVGFLFPYYAALAAEGLQAYKIKV